MFKKAKYIYAFILFFIVIALFLFSSNLYAAWVFDTTPPVTTITILCDTTPITSENPQCAEDSVTVTLECDDSGIGQSGCKTINYGYDVSVASCQTTQYTADYPVPGNPTFTIQNDGNTNWICFESIDNAGNISTEGADGPTPAIVFIGSWFKLKDASFNSGVGRAINLPLIPEKYDDEDDTTDAYLIIGSGGVVLSPSTYTITGWQYSEDNWNNQSYTYKNSFSPENYKDYVLSSREYNEITELINIETDQINYYVGNISSSQVSVAKAPFVLLVDGNITFDDVNFNASDSSVALIATENITINLNVESIGGIIAATNISLADADSNTPLKITGNIISTNEVETSIRERTDDRTKPSFFVVFSPKMYIELIDHLSRATYDWKQLQ